MICVAGTNQYLLTLSILFVNKSKIIRYGPQLYSHWIRVTYNNVSAKTELSYIITITNEKNSYWSFQSLEISTKFSSYYTLTSVSVMHVLKILDILRSREGETKSVMLGPNIHKTAWYMTKELMYE